MELKKKYEDVVWEYVISFSRMFGIDFDYWVGDDVGGIAVYGDYYINFDDLRYSVDKDEPLIFDWYDEALDAGLNDKPFPNFKNYCKMKKKELK